MKKTQWQYVVAKFNHDTDRWEYLTAFDTWTQDQNDAELFDTKAEIKAMVSHKGIVILRARRL